MLAGNQRIGCRRPIHIAGGTVDREWHPTTNRLDVEFIFLTALADHFQFHTESFRSGKRPGGVARI